MRIILDTDKKTITVPWNYGAKLDEMRKILLDASASDEKLKEYTFTGYIDTIWKKCIAESDTRVKTASKPNSKKSV